jgi:hypothetical protein
MSGPLKPSDEYDAVRMVVEILKDFKSDEQERIIRWAQEKLGFAGGPNTAVPGYAIPGMAIPGVGGPGMTMPGVGGAAARGASDISSFMQAKNPSNDVQFATAVAYFYAFDAPEATKKPEIGAADLKEATRLTSRPRIPRPINTLHNAVARGYLDKGSARGTFKINTVGENLVAMSLPTTSVAATAPRRTRPARKK